MWLWAMALKWIEKNNNNKNNNNIKMRERCNRRDTWSRLVALLLLFKKIKNRAQVHLTYGS